MLDDKRDSVQLGPRLRALRGRHSQAEIAAKAGVSQSALSLWERGERVPDVDAIVSLAKIYECSLEYLLAGEGIGPDLDLSPEHQPTSRVARRMAMRDGREVVWIPMYSATPRAGVGVAESEWKEDAIPLRADELRELGVPASDLASVIVQGDSMAPTLGSGDKVLVDMRVDQPHRDGIHVFRVGDALMVKRLQWRPDQGVRVVSDNPAYEPFEIDADKLDQLVVVGRVIRAWKEM